MEIYQTNLFSKILINMKLNKKEIVSIEGFDWSIEVEMETDIYDTIDDLLTEAATRGVEGAFYSSPEEFKIGAVAKVFLKRSNEYIKYFNAYTILCNASMFELAENIRKNYLDQQKVDLMDQPIIMG